MSTTTTTEAPVTTTTDEAKAEQRRDEYLASNPRHGSEDDRDAAIAARSASEKPAGQVPMRERRAPAKAPAQARRSALRKGQRVINPFGSLGTVVEIDKENGRVLVDLDEGDIPTEFQVADLQKAPANAPAKKAPAKKAATTPAKAPAATAAKATSGAKLRWVATTEEDAKSGPVVAVTEDGSYSLLPHDGKWKVELRIGKKVTVIASGIGRSSAYKIAVRHNATGEVPQPKKATA